MNKWYSHHPTLQICGFISSVICQLCTYSMLTPEGCFWIACIAAVVLKLCRGLHIFLLNQIKNCSKIFRYLHSRPNNNRLTPRWGSNSPFPVFEDFLLLRESDISKWLHMLYYILRIFIARTSEVWTLQTGWSIDRPCFTIYSQVFRQSGTKSKRGSREPGM